MALKPGPKESQPQQVNQTNVNMIIEKRLVIHQL